MRRNNTRFWAALLVVGVTSALQAGAAQVYNTSDTTVAFYNFDGRTAPGTSTIRPHDDSSPYSGEDYVPSAAAGELGPTLENPMDAGTYSPSFYRSYVSNDTVVWPDAEVLELRQYHTGFQDYYRTRNDEGTLPATGSFTWETVMRVSPLTTGVTTGGNTNVCFIIDNQFLAEIEPGVFRGRGANLRVENVNSAAGTFDVRFGVVYGYYGWTTYCTMTGLSTGDRYRISAVYDDDAGTMALYLGDELQSWANVTSYGTRSTDFALFGGKSIDNTSTFNPGNFLGSVDAVALSNAALRPGMFVLPEPSTVVMLGLCGLVWLRRRRP